MTARELTDAVKARAWALGFTLVGVAPAEVAPVARAAYLHWLRTGRVGGMAYMERTASRRLDPREVLPSAGSIVSLGINYHARGPRSLEALKGLRGWIARYAWGEDYHEVLRPRLRALEEFLREAGPGPVESRSYVDTGPVLERAIATRAGLGWVGKNTCLLNQELGSWLFLSEILTSAELLPDEPILERCGTCARCIEACPTGALVAPYELDSRRCISYLTIELKGPIPSEQRPAIGAHLFGCDICQDVCPWNQEAPVTDEEAFRVRKGLVNPSLGDLVRRGRPGIRALMKGSALGRARLRGFLRNLAVVLGNSGREEAIPLLEELNDGGDPLIAEHVNWARGRVTARRAADPA